MSRAAALVVAGVIPIELQVAERRRIHRRRTDGRGRDITEEKRDLTLSLWQKRFESDEERDRWTAGPIPQISVWLEESMDR